MASEKMSTRTKLIIVIPIIAIALNGLGYLVATKMRGSSQALPDARGNRLTAEAASDERAFKDNSAERVVGQDRDEASQRSLGKGNEEKAVARRAAGLAELDRGDYNQALADFAEAQALAGDKAYVAELIRVTEDLARRAPVTRHGAPPPPPPRSAPPAPHFAAHTRPLVRPIAPRESLPTTQPPAPMPPLSSGLLLVTTTPHGLLVQVDDVPLDLTPTKASLRIGSHHVEFFDGDRKIFETNVDVKAGAPTTLLRDFSADVAHANPPPSPSTSPPALAKEEMPPMASSASPAMARESPAPAVIARRQAPPTEPAPTTGALDITSPGLYGEVWINGRPWGFSPVRARDLPAGPARIGVRVNGVEERSAVVAVRAGVTTAVRLRRRE